MIKKTILLKLTVMVSVCCMAVTLHAQDTLRLTLDEALQIALSENLTVKVADKEISRTGYAKKGAYAALYPQIEFSANYQRSIKKQTMYIEGEAIQFGMDNSWSTGFNLGMPLVSATLWKSLKISAMDVELSVEKARASRIELIEQVQQAFYGTLLAMDSYVVYKENYDNTVRSYNETKDKYQNGKVSKYDFIRTEVAMKNAEPAVYDALNNIFLSQWKLKALIGIDLNTNIACVGGLYDYRDMLVKVTGNENISLENNTDLRQLEMQMGILDQTYKMQLAKFYPSLNLSLSWQWNAMTNNFKFSTFKWNPYSIGGLSLVIPIFSGGERYYSLKQTRVQQEQLQLQEEDLRRGLEVQVKQLLNTLETSTLQFSASQSGIEGAETGYMIAEKRYEVGSGTLLELDDARLALVQARMNLNQSIYNYLIAKSSLEKVIGEVTTLNQK